MEKNRKKYLQIPKNIFNDRRLKSQDISLLVFFFFLTDGKEETLDIEIEKILKGLLISRNQFALTLKRLARFNWINILVGDESVNMLKIEIKNPDHIPEINRDPYKQPGSRIARAWNKYFGNRMIKYEDVQEFKEFVLDGMEEELVLKVMEYSGLKAEGSPFHYARAILLDLFSRGILTVEGFEMERKGESKDGQRISKDDREKKKRDARKEFGKEEYR